MARYRSGSSYSTSMYAYKDDNDRRNKLNPPGMPQVDDYTARMDPPDKQVWSVWTRWNSQLGKNVDSFPSKYHMIAKCRYCGHFIKEGHHITWARVGDAAGTLWHAACAPVGEGWHLKGRATNSSATNETASETTTSTSTATTTASNADNADIISAVVNALNEQIVPRMDAFGAQIVSDLTKKITDEMRLRDDKIDSLTAKITKLEKSQPTIVHYTNSDGKTTKTKIERKHKSFDKLLSYCRALSPARRNIWLAGPAGAGKTFISSQIAESMGLPFEFYSAIADPVQLTGYLDANHNYKTTAFRRIYENGGVILLDECSASFPPALLELNAATANEQHSFPDKVVKRHKDCYIFAADNTNGFGDGGSVLVGRNKLDGPFLDRFISCPIDYDPDLEAILSDNHDWLKVVVACRANAANSRADLIVSPRATFAGCDLLRNGISKRDTVDAVFGKFRFHSQYATIFAPAEAFANSDNASDTTTNSTPNTTIITSWGDLNDVQRQVVITAMNPTTSPSFTTRKATAIDRLMEAALIDRALATGIVTYYINNVA